MRGSAAALNRETKNYKIIITAIPGFPEADIGVSFSCGKFNDEDRVTVDVETFLLASL